MVNTIFKKKKQTIKKKAAEQTAAAFKSEVVRGSDLVGIIENQCVRLGTSTVCARVSERACTW